MNLRIEAVSKYSFVIKLIWGHFGTRQKLHVILITQNKSAYASNIINLVECDPE